MGNINKRIVKSINKAISMPLGRKEICECWIPQIVLPIGKGWCTTCGGWAEVSAEEVDKTLKEA